MGNNQGRLDFTDARTISFSIYSGTPGLTHLIANYLEQHGFRDSPDATILIILDAPHRFALDALETAKLLGRHCCSQRYAVSSSACPEYLKDLWDHGLNGLLAHGSSLDNLPDLVRRVAHGNQQRTSSVPQSTLTACERQVLRLVADGLGNKQIATQLGRTYQNVKNIVSHILLKLHRNNREELILYYWSIEPLVQKHA